MNKNVFFVFHRRDFFAEKGMHLITKTKGRHVALVENAIRNIKRKIVLMMRTEKSENWMEFLSGTQLLNVSI